MLDIVLALDRTLDRCELLKINEPFQLVAFRKAFDEPGTVLEYAADKIARHTDIEDAVRERL